MGSQGDTLNTDLRKARHTMRGRLNALKLCISALPTCETTQEAAEFLLNIEQETDKLVHSLDEYEALFDAENSER